MRFILMPIGGAGLQVAPLSGWGATRGFSWCVNLFSCRKIVAVVQRSWSLLALLHFCAVALLVSEVAYSTSCARSASHGNMSLVVSLSTGAVAITRTHISMSWVGWDGLCIVF